MELIASIKNISMYEKIASKVDGIVLGCAYSFYANETFEVEDIIKLASKINKNGKKLFLLVNLVMHNEFELEVREFLSQFKNVDVYFIYQDLGVFQILNELGLTSKGIYFPLTMICNYQDLLVYDELGVDGVGLSNEITLDDVNLCSSKSNKVFYLGFGYNPMYQTYRKIVNLYQEYSGLQFENKNLSIRELSKEDVVPMIENKYGAVIFRRGVISILEQIEKVQNVKYLYLDGIFLDEEKQIKVIETYSDVIANKITKEEGLNILNEMNFVYANKFMNEDSVYNPEDF